MLQPPDHRQGGRAFCCPESAINISFKLNIEAIERGLDDLRRQQLPFATALALTETGKDVRAAEIKEMRSVFDRPTPFTLNALYVVPATKNRLVARVHFKDRSSGGFINDVVSPHIYAGARRPKRLEILLRSRGFLGSDEFIVPGVGARLDAFGNISRGQVQQILSALGAQFDPHANRTKSARSKRNAKLAQFFVPQPGSKLPRGVYQRFGFALGSAIKPVLIFVAQPVYKRRLDFDGIGMKTADRVWPVNFELAMERALATAKRF